MIAAGVLLAGAVVSTVLYNSRSSGSDVLGNDTDSKTLMNALLGMAIGGYVAGGASLTVGTVFLFSSPSTQAPSAGITNHASLPSLPGGMVVGVQLGITF